jgi:ribonuclease HI
MVEHRKSKRLYGGYTGTTSNRMELASVIHTLNWVTRQGTFNVDLYSDSQYVVKGVNQWLWKWKRNQWISASGTDVKNKDLWQELYKMLSKHSIKFHWVKGHAGDRFNEEADYLARKGAQYKK